jgi:hypothetical protein
MGTNADSVYRLDRRLLRPLSFLLAMPLVTVARELAGGGVRGKALAAAGLMGVVVILFLPWLTRRVTVSPGGIASSMAFRTIRLAWGEVTRVSAFAFRGRSLVVLEGAGKRLVVTDVVGGFRHLVGYITEHASRASIAPEVYDALSVPGRTRRDALVLWTAAAVMFGLIVLRMGR